MIKACVDCEPRDNCDFIKTEHGYCCYSFPDDSAWIFNLYVYKEYRRQGVAKEILTMCIECIREKGYSGSIKIQAAPIENSIPLEKLERLYLSMGLTLSM